MLKLTNLSCKTNAFLKRRNETATNYEKELLRRHCVPCWLLFHQVGDLNVFKNRPISGFYKII